MSKLAKTFDVSGCTSIGAMLSATDSGWEPSLRQVFTVGADGMAIPDDDTRAIVRPDTDEVLGYVSPRYKAQSHVEQLLPLEPLVIHGTIVPANVSVWEGGKVIAYQFRCPDLDVTVRGKDLVSPLLTFGFWHDGMGSDRAFFSSFRWYCKNQMGQIAKLDDGDRIRHRGDNADKYAELVSGRIQQLKTDLVDYSRQLGRIAESPRRLAPSEALGYFASVIDPSGDQKEIVGEILAPPGSSGQRPKLIGTAKLVKDVYDIMAVQGEEDGEVGSIWSAYNALTRYISHEAGRSESIRSANALFGAPAKRTLGASNISHAFDAARLLAA